MPGKDGDKLKKRKKKIKTAMGQVAKNTRDEKAGFNAAVNSLNENIERYKNEKLTAETAEQLMSVYKTAITAVSRYILEATELTPKAKESVEKMRRALGKDIRVLYNYKKRLEKDADGKKPNLLTFNELLEVSRSKRIEVDSEKVETAGAGQHVRAVIPTENGNVFFTESEKVGYLAAEKKKLLDSYSQKYGANADFLNDDGIKAIVDSVIRYGVYKSNNLKPGMSSFDDIIKTYKEQLQNEYQKQERDGKESELSFAYIKMLNRADTPLKKKILVSYIWDYKKMRLAAIINRDNGIHENCYQDKRNSAMSFIAEELGMGELIAHSENVHITFNEGGKKRTVKGTAMNAAVGEDINKVGVNSNFKKMSLGSFENVKLIKQVASLQVLDYICGNMDRHIANYSYQLDAEGNLTGIQGFDNDSSLGALFNATGFCGRSVPIKNFRIIPESVANEVMKMDEDMLSFMLHGFDLNAAEIKKACDRLKAVKTAITKSREAYRDVPEGQLLKDMPRIVKDEKLSDYSFTKDLAVWERSRNGKDYGNMFGMIKYAFSSGKAVNEVKATLNDIISSNVQTIVSDSWTEIDADVKTMVAQNPRRALGSPQFDEMLNETKELRDLLMTFDGPLFTEKVDRVTKEKQFEYNMRAQILVTKIERVKELTDKYLNERAYPRRANTKSKSSRAYKRFAIAMKNKAMMAKLDKCFAKIENAYAEKQQLAKEENALKAEAKRKDKELAEKYKNRQPLQQKTRNL